MAAGTPNFVPMNERLRALLNTLTVAELLEMMNLIREAERLDADIFPSGTTGDDPSVDAKDAKAKDVDRGNQAACCSKGKAKKVKAEDPGDLDFAQFAALNLNSEASGSRTCASAAPPPPPPSAAGPPPSNTPFAGPTWHGPFYVVRVGRQVGIFTDWGFVAPLVLGVSGAIHKKFDGYWDALVFFHGGDVRIVP